MTEFGGPKLSWAGGPDKEAPVSAGGAARAPGTVPLTPDVCPSWLRPLLDNVGQMPDAYRRRLPADVLAMVTAARTASAHRDDREAAVLVLFSGPESGPADGGVPDDADLLLTVRASSLRHHAGQAAFPGGASDAEDHGPVDTALREAHEETGIDVTRLHPLVTMEKTFIAPSQFHVVPVLAYSPDPGPVAVVNEAETAIVSRVPVRAFINPDNRLMVYRGDLGNRWAGPAFLLNQMLVWGFTGQVISAVLDVAGWAKPWDTNDVRELDDAMVLVGRQGGTR
ncbi:NUDIX hydrolase [Mycobacterium montefiorense]|uniref:Coenzyme A pyrophosphatase n=1 Tax=Mycobacterium montefiorense TaxID=154654 RepID=A0AA37UVM1_9MYCO|nr:CoA pyrophosphatase [Mycobacterium montefiorense]GBG36023.1 coenzyme A pyrophosphatase [Mycobacterium montefiorense]GKU34023.1 coenzyme A pyrophosphatase [Mycobacterium montefiorense]GKU41421.1 coenzyme A pyrophosphatase [Mycobacterium montefiorense]GKU47519.1 coenzyme A pyrophosphatase [Mycobacterium montefiorense]GKU52318.1 coenzyme A pyrophosphatase [Mycobacterium montefiorense]